MRDGSLLSTAQASREALHVAQTRGGWFLYMLFGTSIGGPTWKSRRGAGGVCVEKMEI